MLLDLKCAMPCQQIHYASGFDTSTHFSKVVEAQGLKITQSNYRFRQWQLKLHHGEVFIVKTAFFYIFPPAPESTR